MRSEKKFKLSLDRSRWMDSHETAFFTIKSPSGRALNFSKVRIHHTERNLILSWDFEKPISLSNMRYIKLVYDRISNNRNWYKTEPIKREEDGK